MISEATQLRIANDGAAAALYADSDFSGHTPEMRRRIEHALDRHRARIQASQRRNLPFYRFRVGPRERVTVVQIKEGWRVHHTSAQQVLRTDGAWVRYEGPAMPDIVWTDQEEAEEAAIVSILDA